LPVLPLITPLVRVQANTFLAPVRATAEYERIALSGIRTTARAQRPAEYESTLTRDLREGSGCACRWQHQERGPRRGGPFSLPPALNQKRGSTLCSAESMRASNTEMYGLLDS
jgi:hypothetical protein